MTDPWVRKLLAGMDERGDAVVVHGLRGRVSSGKIADEVRDQALAILARPDWYDFGPTFASEHLVNLHGIRVERRPCAAG